MACKGLQTYHRCLPLLFVRRSFRVTSHKRIHICQNSVLVSISQDIFVNLAFEDWLYKNLDFRLRGVSLLLMWSNSPAVVIGRHQNPWLECSVDYCEKNGIDVVRRNSGGGCVYHDYGNVNFSFFTPRANYDRGRNLELICTAIRERWAIDLNVSKRHDILFNEKYKVSGTASKLGKDSSYHHCTVLVNVDMFRLHEALHRNLVGVTSKATSSNRSEVINLNSVCSSITVDDVIKSVGEAYRALYNVKDIDAVTLLPTEELCPGLMATKNDLKTWEWRFGRTPSFTIRKFFELQRYTNFELFCDVEFVLTVEKGIVKSILMDPPVLDTSIMNEIKSAIVGRPLSKQLNEILIDWAASASCRENELCRFAKDGLLKMVLDVLG